VDLWFRVGIHDCFGAGIFGPLYNYWGSISQGSFSTVFSAEMMAILRCAELLLTKRKRKKKGGGGEGEEEEASFPECPTFP
jgi:hypothetical protein